MEQIKKEMLDPEMAGLMGDKDKEVEPRKSQKDESISNSSRTRRAETKNSKCCCCCSITTGINLIMILDIFYVLAVVSFTIVLFFDSHLHWWYPLVNMCLAVSLGFTALALVFSYACTVNDSKQARKRVATA